MAGLRLPFTMGLGEQRGGARDEEPHPRRGLDVQPLVLEKAHVEGRDAHQHGRPRHQLEDPVDVELRQEDHRRAGEERDVGRDEEAVGVEDRQSMDQHVIGGVGPSFAQRERVRDEVAVGQHRALGASGGARGVEQRGEIVGRALHRREVFRCRLCRVRQGPLALRVERDERRARLGGRLQQRLAPGRVADEDGGLGVADEVLDLCRGVAGVERQEGAARPHRAEIEDDRFDRLLDLGGDAVAGLHAEADEGVRHSAGAGDEVGIGDALAGGGLDRDGGRVGDAVRQEGEEIGVHGVHRNERGQDWGAGGRAARTESEAAIRPFSASASWFFSIWPRS